jgi:hypothetical protein
VFPVSANCHAKQNTIGSSKKVTPSFIGRLKKVSKEVMIKIPNRPFKYAGAKNFATDI